MNNFYWLVKREFWEHRGSFLWAPVCTAGATVLLIIMAIVAGEVVRVHKGIHAGLDMGWLSQRVASGEHFQQAGNLLDLAAATPALIVSVVLFFVLFSYCMKTLSADRRDRSILFWKSLPTSDLSTVASKAFSAVVVAPVIAVVVGIIAAILTMIILAITGAFHGLSIGTFWTLSHPGNIVVGLGGLLPIYMVWMLPTVGWLMLCSAWASGRVARWALAVPIGISVLISWISVMGLFDMQNGWFWKNVVSRLLFSLFPGSWLSEFKSAPLFVVQGGSGQDFKFNTAFNSIMHNLGGQYQLLLTADFLWGALAGLVMLAGAVWLRRWRAEA